MCTSYFSTLVIIYMYICGRNLETFVKSIIKSAKNKLNKK